MSTLYRKAKIVVLIAATLVAASLFNEARCFISIKQDTAVLICVSATAYAYHKDFCRGLKACTHEVKKVTLQKALELGRRPCGYCY